MHIHKKKNDYFAAQMLHSPSVASAHVFSSVRIRLAFNTSPKLGRPVISNRYFAQTSYTLFAAVNNAGTFVNEYTHPNPTHEYAFSNTSTPVMTFPLYTPCIVAMPVS